MAEHDRPDLIERHGRRERLQHWVMALLFLLAAASGMALFHPALFWLSAVLGGGVWSVILHPFVGLAMALVFARFAAPQWEDNRLLPNDRAWLDNLREVIEGRDEHLPEVGKYNAGQKVLYFVMVACVAVLALTGLAIWRRYFAGGLPVSVVRAAALLHALAAFVLVLGAIVHVAAALWVKGTITAMTRGTVTVGWAWKHHRAWFRQMIRPTASR